MMIISGNLKDSGMKTSTACCLMAALLCLGQLPAIAEVRLSGLFGNHMVLQRDMPVAVWGTAVPAERVTVSFAGHSASTAADLDGKWRLSLPAMDASSESRRMIVEASNKVVLEDILVGEVWICSGQSNMQYGWGSKAEPMFAWGEVPELAALAADARGRPVRSYTVPTNVAFSPSEDCKGRWSTDVSGSAVAFGFSYHLQKALEVPVAVIVTCWGSSSIEGWMPIDMTAQLPHFKAIMDRFAVSETARNRVQAAIDRGISHGNVFVRKQPNLLYNAMLHPVIPISCRGMVWYQGEANAAQPAQYAASLPLWVKRLRKAWGREDLQFLAVMLPGFGKDDGIPDTKSWASFREAQMKVLDLPGTAIVNTIDLGDAKNIHPEDKEPICERLVLLARRNAYGQEIEAEGPAYKRHTIDGPKMSIEFDHATGLMTKDGNPPTGFWLAGADRSWRQADATIAGTTVLLQSSEIKAPVACRYAFCGKPAVNLVNRDHLPAYPFRTDDWDH